MIDLFARCELGGFSVPFSFLSLDMSSSGLHKAINHIPLVCTATFLDVELVRFWYKRGEERARVEMRSLRGGESVLFGRPVGR